jgi:hypothetical protein
MQAVTFPPIARRDNPNLMNLLLQRVAGDGVRVSGADAEPFFNVKVGNSHSGGRQDERAASAPLNNVCRGFYFWRSA